MKMHTPQTGEDRFLQTLANVFKQQYANPNRVGCVGRSILWKLASRPLAFRNVPQSESTLRHLSECAARLDEFETLRRRVALARRLLIAAIVCAASLSTLGAVHFFVRR